MHRIDTSTATSDGKFTEGNPTVPVPATTVSADWLNAVQEELVAAIASAGLEPDKSDNTQLRQAIGKLISTAVDAARIHPATVAPKAPGTAAVGTSPKFAREDHVHPEQTSVSKLETARSIDGVNFNGSAAITHYAECSTAAATAAKAVSLAGFTLVKGAKVTVRFTATNTAANATLNVSNTGAKAIQYRNAAISAGALAANRTYEFVYDGSSWELVGDLDSNTTYGAASTSEAGIVQLSSAVNSPSETQAATSKAVKTAYDAGVAAAAAADAAQDTADNAYTEATKEASTTQAGRVQLSNRADGSSTTLAATEYAVKKAWDKAAAAGVVKLKGTRTSKGTWTLTGLTVGKPLFVLGSAPADNRGNSYCYLNAISGTNDGLFGTAQYRFLLGSGNGHCTNPLVVVPTETSVSFDVISFAGNFTVRAYQ